MGNNSSNRDEVHKSSPHEMDSEVVQKGWGNNDYSTLQPQHPHVETMIAVHRCAEFVLIESRWLMYRAIHRSIRRSLGVYHTLSR
jgi:hypothetical protein